MSKHRPLPIDRILELLQKYSDRARKERGENGSITAARLKVQANRGAQIFEKLTRPYSLILGDPVGTGKTAVALAAAKALMEQRGVEYAMVVAPNETVADLWRERAKWVGFTPAERWIPGKLRVVTKRSLPNQGTKDPAATLLIVDEAHRGLQDENSPIYEKLRPVAEGTRLLLVTATPFQLSTNGFLNMLELADTHSGSQRREHIREYGKAMVRLLRRCHAQSLEAPGEADESAEADEAADKSFDRALEAVKGLRPNAQDALRVHLMDPYPRKEMGVPAMPALRKNEINQMAERWERGYQVARIVPELVKNQGDMFQRRLLSCNAAFWRGKAGTALRKEADKKVPVKALVDELDRYLGAGGVQSAAAKVIDIKAERGHPKIAATVSQVRKWVHDDWRHVLVFCTFGETQQVLKAVLEQELGVNSVSAPDGAAQLKDAIRTRFCDPSAERLALVVRDNLSESLDLDGGQPCLVHHDLTWNPARMEQRWGRVVRISSNFRPVAQADIFCPVLSLEANLRMFATVNHRGAMVDLIPDLLT